MLPIIEKFFIINKLILKPFVALLISLTLPFHPVIAQSSTTSTEDSSCLKEASSCSSNVCQEVCEDEKVCFGWKWFSDNNACQKIVDTESMLTDCDESNYESQQYTGQVQCVEEQLSNLKNFDGTDAFNEDYSIDKDISVKDGNKIVKAYKGINTEGSFGDTILGSSNLTKVIFWTYSTLLVALGATLIAGKTVFKSCKTSKSLYFITLGAAVAFGGEIYLWQDLKKKLTKETDALKDLEETDVASIQVMVFDYLIKNFEHRSQNEKFRHFLHIGTSVIFGIGTALALFEMAKAKPCVAKEEPSTDTIPAETAPGLIGPLIGAIKQILKGTKFQLATAVGRSVLSGLLMGMSITLSHLSKKVSDISKERGEFVQKIRQGLFESTLSYYCSKSDSVDGNTVNRRENPNIPRCYCYKSDGSKNITARNRSDICQQYWDRFQALKAPKAIESNKKITEQSGCVTIDGEFDPLCKCRTLKNQKKENACLKEDQQITSSAPGGVGRYMNDTGNLVSSVGNGSLATGSFSPATSSRAAAKLKRIIDQKSREVNSDRAKNGKQPIDFLKAQKGLLSQINKKISPSDRKSLASSLSAASGQIPASSGKSSRSSLRKAKRNQISYKTGRKTNNQAKKKQLNFNQEGFSSRDRVQNIRGTSTGKRYKIKNTISQKSSESIWKILSSRYQKSAFQRLFQDD